MSINASNPNAREELVSTWQRERAAAKRLHERVDTLTRERQALVPLAVVKVSAACATTERAVRTGWSCTENALRFGTAAAAAPLVAPFIGHQVAGLPGAGLGWTLGIGKCAEFLGHAGRYATEAAWLPPWLFGEAVVNVLEGAYWGLMGNPGYDGSVQGLDEALRVTTAAQTAADARVHCLENTLRRTCDVAPVPRLLMPAPPEAPRLKVVVCSLSAGGGHDAAARAITEALGDAYEVTVVHPFDDGAEAYNAAQAHSPAHVLDLFGHMQRITNTLNQVLGVSDALYGERMNRIIEEENPALIISTVPMENATTWRAAQRHGCPMVVVPTDLEFAHFLDTIHDPGDNFKVLLPFAHTRTQAAHLPDSVFAVTGYPVRKAFTTEGKRAAAAHPSTVLKTLGIAEADKVVLVMMGAHGSGEDAMVADAEHLAAALPEALPKASPRVHVVVLRGNNGHISERLQSLEESSSTGQVSVHTVGPCDGVDVATFMTKADLLITKPGGSTVNEALAANLPMLFHSDVGVVHWELGNAAYATENGMAQWANREAFPRLVAEAIAPGRPKKSIPCPSRDFPDNIRRVVTQMLPPTRVPSRISMGLRDESSATSTETSPP